MEGCYALSPLLRPYYDFAILIDTPFEKSRQQAISRDIAAGADPKIGELLWEEIYYPHEKQYFSKTKVKEVANLIVRDFDERRCMDYSFTT